MNRIPIPFLRVWLRYCARAIAGVKGNFKKSLTDMSCCYCDLGATEDQEHLELCGGTKFKRRGLELENWRHELLFWICRYVFRNPLSSWLSSNTDHQ